jgi:hypothetical protein
VTSADADALVMAAEPWFADNPVAERVWFTLSD